MNILFIIGNGFDLNIGMATRYSDFYSEYKAKESSDALIKNLKESMTNKEENWSCLELALGNYTKNLKSTAEFDVVFQDILNELGDYLERVEKKFDFSQLDKHKLYKYLTVPEESLPKAENLLLKKYKNNWNPYDHNISIITLNYTRTIEKILEYQEQPIKLGFHHSKDIVLKSIEHLHGFVNERMIMGVNDVSQISNISFQTNQDVSEALIKSFCNKVQKHTVDDNCFSKIQSANLICIFGSSIGDTDNCWWELIGENLKRKDLKLIVFTKGEEINPRIGFLKERVVREMKDYFLNKTKLTEDEKIAARANIYVGVNTKIFSDLKAETYIDKETSVMQA